MKRATIAVLGPKNTYSDLVLRHLRPKAQIHYAMSIGEVFEWVSKGRVVEGLVPLENSLTGSVRETLDELFSRNVSIAQVVAQPIHLALVGVKKTPLSSLRTIYSHPQALLQCRRFLRKHCPKAVLVPMESTTLALERIRAEGNPRAAAIAAPLAARAYHLKIMRDRVEDNLNNTTFFALIRRGAAKGNLRARKTSIAFTFSKDSSGSLYSVFGDFAHAGINLTKIESRPNPAVSGDYVFYVDFEGNPAQPRVRKAIHNIQQKVVRLKILGFY